MDTLFRKFKDGSIIALFPEYSKSDYTCCVSARLGNDGLVFEDVTVFTVDCTQEAEEREYDWLRTVLASQGYATIPVKEMTPTHFHRRVENIKDREAIQ